MTTRIRTVVVSCDSDFDRTFRPIMKAVKKLLKHDPDASPERVRRFVKDAIPAYYRAYQGRDEDDLDSTGTVRYLCKAQVLFNEDAERMMAKDRDGGSWYLRDGKVGTL